MINLRLTNSLTKSIGDSPISELTSATMLSHETYDFQVVIEGEVNQRKLALKFDGVPNDCVTYYLEKSVICRPVFDRDIPPDDYYLTKKEAMIPDILMNVNHSGIGIYPSTRTVVFVSIRSANGLEEGVSQIKVTLVDEEGHDLASNYFALTVKDGALPPHDLILTNWFHYDSLADTYGLKPFSKAYYRILGPYIDNYLAHGNNMIFTPLFTPCLDTKVGGERMTVQLVKIKKEKSNYLFDFKALAEFMDFMDRRGVRYFEFAHLFTQWGAAFCPKVIVRENGKDKKAFGWTVSSTSPEYQKFLRSLLTALRGFLEEKGYQGRCFFHISDEPRKEHVELYKQHAAILKECLPGYPIMDALSHYEYHSIVSLPVVALDYTEEFLANHQTIMVYCCVGQDHEYVSNRFIEMPSLRNRILGFQLFLNEAKGFLQYGHNYYYDFLSEDFLNPYIDNDAGDRFPAGDSFMVYPGRTGPINSLRHEVFREAISDYRLALLLSRKIGRPQVENIMKRHGMDGYKKYSHSESDFFSLRDELVSLL